MKNIETRLTLITEVSKKVLYTSNVINDTECKAIIIYSDFSVLSVEKLHEFAKSSRVKYNDILLSAVANTLKIFVPYESLY